MKTTKVMAALCVAIILSAGCFVTTADNNQEVQPADAELITIFFLVLSGIAVGYILGTELKKLIDNDVKNSPTGTDQILRLNQADAVTVNLHNTLSHDAAYARDEPALVAFTSSYFQRMGELAAAENWKAGATMDYDKILEASRAYEEYNTFMLNRENIINTLFEPIKSLPKTLKASSTYSSMTVSLTAGADYTAVNSATGNYCMGMKPALGADECYIYNGGTTKSGFIYTTAPTTITGQGKTYTTQAGYNSTGEWPAGVYKVAPGGLVMGSIMPTRGAAHGSVYPACVLQADDKLIYVMDYGAGGRVATYNGTDATISSIGYKITTDGQTRTADLTPGLDYIKTLSDASVRIFSDTLNAATAAWQVYNTAGKASIFVSPSMLMPNLENMGLTSEQSYLVYMAALQQMSDYYKTATDNFDVSKVFISEDSLDLICHGTIYSDQSKTIPRVQDAYFTPLCYLRDQGLIIGQDTVFLQDGLAMVWERQPDGQMTGKGLVVLENGATMVLDSMDYRGQHMDHPGDTLVLKVKSLPDMEKYKVISPPKPPEPPKDYSLIRLVLIVVGIVALAYGAIAGRPEFLIGGVLALLFAFLGLPMLVKWGIL